ncbi:hypothetical protein [uncultured Kordia sp.]|nr:hypothetical protein [uncultured Kordia sp.]
MCEKCAHPEMEHLHDENAIKPLQKKLKTTALKVKLKQEKLTSNQ